MMVRKALILIVIVALSMVVITSAAAQTLEVHKLVDHDGHHEIRVGDEVTVLLSFNNPFKRPISLQIVDRNVFGNNGLDIQCLEYTLPAEEESIIAYSESIVPFKPGTYTLDAAKVTYTSPDTGKKETVESNTLDVVVKENNTWQPVQAQGITTLYQCNGTNFRSTSYSSTSTISSLNIQIGGSSSSYNYSYSFGRQQSSTQQGGIGQRVENNQLNQNTEQLKKELEKEMQRQRELEEEIQQELAHNPEFLRYNEQLTIAGFNQSEPSLYPLAQNHTEITIPYRNESTGAERRIKADYSNGTIQNVTLESTPPAKGGAENPWLWLLLLIPIAGVTLAGWFIYDKYLRGLPRHVKQSLPPDPQQSVDYISEAKKMVEEAERLFRNSREKDAYEKVSQALRFYFSRTFDLKSELLNTELLSMLREKNDEALYARVKECLDLCGLVEFAKYKANEDDFEKIVRITKEVMA